ncbi:MAG: hypothetical protein K0Q59_4775 [Paenibacillus sp.]|nr:hypothetical protein [Paenibacillus sp.]
MKLRVIIGTVLMLFGAFLFFNQGGDLNTGSIFAYFWASMFVIPLGLFFHWLYFGMIGRKGVGLLIPGGILLVAGMVCQIAMLFDSWYFMWPGFILAPAVGLFEFYWFGSRNKWLLIPINILFVLSLLFFMIFSTGALFHHLSGQPLIAIVILIAGAFLLVGSKKGA